MTQPDFAAIRADQVAEALAKIEAEPAWHRPTFKGVHSLMSLMDTPAQCSCGESWDQGVYAVGHAYSANAILEERLSTYLTALVEVARAAQLHLDYHHADDYHGELLRATLDALDD